MSIYLIEQQKKENIITTFSRYIKSRFHVPLVSFSLISKRPKDTSHLSCLEILSLETANHSMSLDKSNNFLKALDELKNSDLNELVDSLPNLEISYQELTYEEKIVFNLVKSFLRSSDCILIEEIDAHISAQTLERIQSAIKHHSVTHSTQFFVKAASSAFWMDTADSFLLVNKENQFVVNPLQQREVEHTQERFAI